MIECYQVLTLLPLSSLKLRLDSFIEYSYISQDRQR